MGWSAYKLKRTNFTTGEELGEINVIFPVMRTQYAVSEGYKTMADLINIPDFPVESTMFAVDAETAESAKNFGFGNTIDASMYVGEKWTLNNDSYIQFEPDNEEHEVFKFHIRFYNNKNERLYSGTSAVYPSPKRSSFAFPLTIVDENTAGNIEQLFYWFDPPNAGKVTFGPTEYGGHTIPDIQDTYATFFADASPIYTDDPYEQGGTTGTGGGTGTFSGTGDEIAIPSLPTLSAVDAGFITLFNPSIEQLSSLASYMWSDLFDINGWRKIFADPMNAILGLSIVPVNVPSVIAKDVKVGNISTGVSMPVASSQYVEIDCGTLNVQEFWGAYLDYDPYTKAEIYLPYIGTHALAVDDIMGKPVHVVYHVDVLSGACCAYVQCGGTVLYTFIGQCSSSIPITGDNWTNVINGAISIAGSIGSMVATGGATAPMAIGNIASTAVNTMKPSIEKSGAMCGTGGMMGVQTPYLILTRPRQALPARQNTFTGYPSFITEQLSTLSGYTEVFKIHLENVPATEQELSEIETLLKTGVIF